MSRRLAWVGMAVLAAYLVFIGGAWFGIYYPALRLISMIASAVVLGVWVVLARRDPSWRPRSALLPAILACLASLAVSTVFSRRPGISFEYLGYAIVLAALYLLLVQLMSRDFFRTRFVSLAGALFIAIVVAYIGFSAVHWAHWLSVLGRLTVPPLRPEFESLTFGNPSTVLTIVALLAMPLVASADWTRRRDVFAVFVVLAVVAVVAVISGSRAGWLALAIAGAVAVVAGGLSKEGRAAIRRVTHGALDNIVWRAVLAVVLIGVAAVVVLLGPALATRLNTIGDVNRIAFVRIALQLFSESPIVGTGPGTWVIQRPALTLPSEPDEYIPHAHDVYAQTLAELGIVGAIAGLVLVVYLLRLAVGAMRSQDTVRRRWGWVTTIGLIYFAAHQALDFYPNFPSILFAAAIPVAWLDASAVRRAAPGPASSPQPPRRRSLRSLGWVAAVVALAMSLGGLGWQEGPALTAARAVDLANAGDWAAADAPAREAAAADSRISSYLFTAGLTAAHAGDHAAAAHFFQQVAATDGFPEAWLNLAAEQDQLGDSANAEISLQRALRLGFQRPAVAFAAGDLALRLGESDVAAQAFATVIADAPSILADPWWSASASRRAAQTAAASSVVRALGPGVAWQVALMLGDQATARRIAVTPGVDPNAVDFVNGWGGDSTAVDHLIATCQAYPFDLTVLSFCARLEGHLGNDLRANDYRYLVNAQNGGSYEQGAELRVATNPLIGRSSEGDPAIFWGLYTYRRYTPWDVLVPSLAHLTLQ